MKLRFFYIISALVAVETAYAASRIPTIVITNSRTEQTLDETHSSIDVISREQIEKSNTNSVVDLLKMRAGIDIAETGGSAQPASVFVRGAANNQTLVLVDGIKANSAVDGTFHWHTLDPATIERIEIVRGAKSSLYGSNAIGGVINIITRKSSGYSLSLGAGSYGIKKAKLGLGVNKEKAGFSLNAVKEKSKNFSAANKKIASTYVDFSDKDPHDRENLNFKFWANLTDKLKINANYSMAEIEAEYDSLTPKFAILGIISCSPKPCQPKIQYSIEEFSDTNRTDYSVKITHEISTRWQQQFVFGKSSQELKLHDIETYHTPASGKTDIYENDIYNADSKHYRFNWQHHIRLQNHNLLAGFDYEKDKANVTSQYADYGKSIINRGLYANLAGKINKFDYSVSVRRDDHEQFDKHTTYKLELGKSINLNWNWRITYGTGFRAPNFTELFYPVFGNPDLKPEKSKNFTLSLTYNAADTNIRFNAYNTKISKLIQFATPTYINIGKAKLRGLEIEFSKNLGLWKLDAALSLQKTKDDKGKKLIRRPEKKLSLNLIRNFKQGHIGIEGLFVAKRNDLDFLSYPATEVSLPGYGLANLSAQYRFQPDLVLNLRIDNLLDKTYETVYGYNTLERSFYAELNYKGAF